MAVPKSDAPYLLGNHGFLIEFVRKPDAKPNEATLRITQPISISGCLEISPLEAKIEQKHKSITVTVADAIVKVDNKPRYTQYGCKQSAGSVSTDITLNRDKMIEGAVNKIHLKSGGGNDQYDVHVDQNKISLFTKTRNAMTGQVMASKDARGKFFFMPAKSSKRTDPLTHWFYPDNLVVVYVPNAQPGADLTDDIKAMAIGGGLTGAEIAIKGFQSPVKDHNTLYFIDNSNKLRGQLKDGKPVPFGEIENMAVYVRQPGLFD